MKVTLIHHQTVALKMSGFEHHDFEDLAGDGICLGQVYRKVMPVSLARVASVLERDNGIDVDILDLRIADPEREEITKSVNWEGYTVNVSRVGAAFSAADEAILASDWLGFSSHFTFESGVVRDLIAYAKQLKPAIQIMVGGADVAARPMDYVNFGADLVFTGDFNPEVFRERTAGSTVAASIVVPPYRHPFAALTIPSFDKLTYLDRYVDSHDGKVPEGVTFPIGFIYFTRGCPRECSFCESRLTKFEALDLDSSIAMLEHYQNAGINTVNFTDDNLLILAAQRGGRDALLTLLATMRTMKFAWEFPNGLEIGRLLRRDNSLDEEMMTALFSHTVDAETGRVVGAYRAYVPIETFDRRTDYRKLKSAHDQSSILAWLAGAGLPELDFGVVITPNADSRAFENTRDGYKDLQALVSANGKTRARYSVFHLIPISLYRDITTKYSVHDFPEGWTFHFPVYDGTTLSARELFESRLRLLKELDFGNYLSMAKGEYSYSAADSGNAPELHGKAIPFVPALNLWELAPTSNRSTV